MLHAPSSHWSIVFQLWFECCKISASVIDIGLAQKSIIDCALPKIQSNLISRTSSLAQRTIYCRRNSSTDLIVKFQNYHCYWWQSAAQLRLWGAVYQRWWCYKYTCEITSEKNICVAIAPMILHHTVMWLTWNQYSTSCAGNNIVNCSILKRLFSKYNAWLTFCSDNATTISEASCCPFHYEKFLIKM